MRVMIELKNKQNMKNLENIEWLRKKLKEQFSKDSLDIDENTLIEDLGIDSLDLVELQLEYENDFEIKLQDNTEELKTVRDLLTLLSRIDD
jgi:acyl carrier protein